MIQQPFNSSTTDSSLNGITDCHVSLQCYIFSLNIHSKITLPYPTYPMPPILLLPYLNLILTSSHFPTTPLQNLQVFISATPWLQISLSNTATSNLTHNTSLPHLPDFTFFLKLSFLLYLGYSTSQKSKFNCHYLSRLIKIYIMTFTHKSTS